MADAASLQVVVLVVDVVGTDIGDAGGILDGKGAVDVGYLVVLGDL